MWILCLVFLSGCKNKHESHCDEYLLRSPGIRRDFAFVASDKDTCMLKCHVFRCNAPAKTIASALHEMCSKVRSHDPDKSIVIINISINII